MSNKTRATCTVCPHLCKLDEGQLGICGVRAAQEGEVKLVHPGLTSSIALDPIEKKPFVQFHPGSQILSWGSIGCNMRCMFCQNHTIARARLNQETYKSPLSTVEYTAYQLVQAALALKAQGNIGIAFTYNEPIISYEFVKQAAEYARSLGLITAAVSNGYATEKTWSDFCDVMDAINIDYKAFDEETYKKLGGGLQEVQRSIAMAVDKGLHVEVTTLVVPGISDNLEQFDEYTSWLAGLNPNIPLHLSRFYPQHKMSDESPTSLELLYKMKELAESKLTSVYLGNV